MSYVRIKNIGNVNGNRYGYAYLVESYWDRANKKSKQRVLRYLGKVPGISAYCAKDIFLRDNYECQLCGDTRNVVIDHKQPLALGGNNDPDNLWVLCKKCNETKGKDPYQ